MALKMQYIINPSFYQANNQIISEFFKTALVNSVIIKIDGIERFECNAIVFDEFKNDMLIKV